MVQVLIGLLESANILMLPHQPDQQARAERDAKEKLHTPAHFAVHRKAN